MVRHNTDQETVTDSVFRLKRVVNADHTTTPSESREVEDGDGGRNTAEIGGPSIVRGAFDGGLTWCR